MNTAHPNRASVLDRAVPIILANASVPLLGLVDAAVIGHRGRVVDLAAVALGALIFSFVYWTFGFLRMGTTGFVAQESGRGDVRAVRAAIGRGLMLATGLGLLLLTLQWPLCELALTLLGGEPKVQEVAAQYFYARIWSAPATLALFAIVGALIGLGQGRTVLTVQLLLACANGAFDVLLSGLLSMGARGIGLGTALAEWMACLFGLWRLSRTLPAPNGTAYFGPLSELLRPDKVRAALSANLDILLRTLCLISGFALFTQQSAHLGSEALASNHVLLQFVSFSAFFLDGYAFVAESLVGEAVGLGNRAHFDAAVRASTELAAVTAAGLAMTLLVLGPHVLDLLTDLPVVNSLARAQLPFAAAYVMLAFPAFQLDGIFIGATATRAMRNASLQAITCFALLCYPLCALWGNRGLWTSFILFVVARAVTLLRYYPALRSSLVAGDSPGTTAAE